MEHYAERKDVGNQHFKKGEYREAVACYKQALELAGTAAERGVACANLSVAALKMGDVGAACEYGEQAVQEDPMSHKAHYRLGNACKQRAAVLAKHDEALPLHTEASEFHVLLRAAEAFGASLALVQKGGGTVDPALRKSLNDVRDLLFRVGPQHPQTKRGAVEIFGSASHGVGMRAVRDIPAGETLLEELPVAWSNRHLEWQAAAQDIIAQATALPTATREWVTALHDNAGDAETLQEKLFCVWDANGHSVGEVDFRIGEYGKAGCALFLAGSRINHSCRPNAVQSFCEKSGKIRLRSLSPIKAGTEITITYVPLHLSRAARAKKLRFVCACPRCAAEEEEVGAEADSVAARYEEISAMAERAEKAKDPNLRDEAAKRVDALLTEVMNGHPKGVPVAGANFMVLLMKCKLWAERQGALPAFELLHRTVKASMPPNWPILISTHMYLGLHKAAQGVDDAEVLGHLKEAFRVHVKALGPGLRETKDLDLIDEVEHFWLRYWKELSELEIDTLERCRMLFSSEV
eukprot:TRINITY_DN32397_c0_g1_i1.p1 TRINITY_DN32397_c0_g1~~TRINITY_DN32397_c0_g1_i1.p1  ORF type:complete len:522 (+),score=226.06 TRINITY_DN32397_c0_g1_i1:82-1647(+)